MVTHGFLPAAQARADRPLFASYHAPAVATAARDVAYVLCPPLHLELIQSYRSMRRCAEELAAAGFHVLRLHYDGTGESVGATDEDPGRVAAWLASVERAAEALRAIAGVASVGLVGVRLGATFALEVATRVEVSHLVLWELVGGAAYGREMAILASSSPQRVPGGLVCAGYWMSDATLAELGALDVEKMAPRGRPEVLLVHRDDRKPSARVRTHLESLGCPTTAAQLAGHKEMLVMPHKSRVPDAILGGIRDWALARSRALDGPVGADLTLEPEAVVDGLRWQALSFGRAGRLFGVLTQPASGVAPGAAPVLLLTGGVTPRTAGNGSYVAIARRLAAKGHAVLRMDVGSIGESGVVDGSEGDGNDGFPDGLLDDTRAGLERASAAAPGAKVWLLGLCSGAYAGFQDALHDARVGGLVLMNPVALRELAKAPGDGDGDTAAASALEKVDQLEQMQRYWQVMRSAESWKKLLSGKADVRHLAGVLRARLGARLAAAKESLEARLGRAPQGLAGDFATLLARGVRVNLVFSEGDPGHALVLGELGARLGELTGKGLRVEVFAGADHNFHELASRRELLAWVDATIG
jgi:pimeloyl-ACP methyl ester carboxylesterase